MSSDLSWLYSIGVDNQGVTQAGLFLQKFSLMDYQPTEVASAECAIDNGLDEWAPQSIAYSTI